MNFYKKQKTYFDREIYKQKIDRDVKEVEEKLKERKEREFRKTPEGRRKTLKEIKSRIALRKSEEKIKIPKPIHYSGGGMFGKSWIR